MDKPDSILIVDDDPEIRRLLVDYLARNSFDAYAARDGREMWQALERHAIDLVVLDLMLPDTDGLTLCRDLRAKSSLPVLMLTARGEETDRIIGIVSPDSAPIKRLVQDAREKGALIDASYGRRTQAVLIMDSDHVILSGIPLESLTGRANEETEEKRK